MDAAKACKATVFCFFNLCDIFKLKEQNDSMLKIKNPIGVGKSQIKHCGPQT